MSKISELLNKIRSAPTKEYDKVIQEVMGEVLKDEFKDVLKEEPFSEIVELMLEIPEQHFEEFIDKYGDLLESKIKEAKPADIGRLYEGLSKPKRKILSINFRPIISRRLASFNLSDIVRMLYNVIPAARETVLNQYKEVMMRPDFSEKILDTPVEILGEFLSLAPESIRRTLIKRHAKVFTSEEFIEKLKSTEADERAKLLRWLPPDISKEIISKLS